MTDLIVAQLANSESRARVPTRSKGRWFFFGAALVMTALVLFSFSSTFYLRGLVVAQRPPTPIAPYIVVHGIIMTAWYFVFAAQAFLAGSRRTLVHRRLGVVGVALAVGVVLTGGYVSWSMPAHLASLGLPPAQQVERFGIHGIVIGNLTMLPFLAGLVATAVVMRRRREWHGRLMFWALVLTLSPVFGGAGARMLEPVLARILPTGLPMHIIAALLLAPAALLLHDWRSRRHIHPATLLGWAAAAAAMFGGSFLAGTDAAQAFYLTLA